MSAADLIANARAIGPVMDAVDMFTLPAPHIAMATAYGVSLGMHDLADLTAWSLHLGSPITDSGPLPSGRIHHLLEVTICGQPVSLWCDSKAVKS